MIVGIDNHDVFIQGSTVRTVLTLMGAMGQAMALMSI